MDRPKIRTEADARTLAGPLAADFLPASRRDLVSLGSAALEAGPVLVTGDAGVGKTWLVNRWTGALAACRWVRVDLTPDDPPALLHRQLGRGLGLLPHPGAALPTRFDIAETLGERALDGERFGLIVEEAQNLGPSLWEEIRLLLNRIGQEDGFAHLILVGQTALVRRFAARTLAAVEARLAAHLHLRPLDITDTRAWLALAEPSHPWREAEVEAIHRDSGGNPARLRRRLAQRAATKAATPTTPSGPLAVAPDATTTASHPSMMGGLAGQPSQESLGPPPLTAAGRPPLHVEENAIEVGWSGDEADVEPIAPLPGSGVDPTLDDEPAEGAVRLDETDQAVHDHYAALQAWREWASNQAHRPSPGTPPRTDRELADEIDRAAEAEAADFFNEPRSGRGLTRTDAHPSEPFAPFGALFARLPRSGEPLPTRP